MAREPKRQDDLGLLWDPFQAKVEQLFTALRVRGFDPKPFETVRSQARQEWLYAQGRTRNVGQKPITWTLKSKHLAGKAVDVVSASRWWDWPKFFAALREEAVKLGLRDCRGGTRFAMESCHVQWGG